MPMLPAFHDVRFPSGLALGVSGGPVRRTEIVALASGHEQRNARWALSRRKYDAGFALRTLADLQVLTAFFEARSGRLHAFRFRDPLDHTSALPGQPITAADQLIGTGDGVAATFQLVKNGLGPVGRPITKPLAGSIRISVNGVEKTAGTQFSTDTLTGLVTFAPGHIPASGMAVTAGFEFDLPVRFDTDEIRISLSAFEAGEVPSIPLIEVLA